MKSFSFSLFSLFFVVACLLFALFLGGCGGDNFGCSANVVRGIEVTVYDAQTHAPIATGAVGTIQDGNYTESLTPSTFDAAGNQIGLGGALGRAGTYTVHIEKTGYTPWEMKNVRVTQNACGVNRVTLQADLQPLK